MTQTAISSVARARHRVVTIVLALVVLGAIALPVVRFVDGLATARPADRLFDEDAYYSFNVARNIAEGHGIVTDADGATSGVQPLWTFVVAGAFVLRDIHVVLAVIGMLSIGLWLVAAWSFARILLRLIPDAPLDTRDRGLLFAAVFLCHKQVRELFWNGLETGLFVALLLVIVDRFIVDGDADRRSDVAFGVALGLLVLARVDGLAFVPVLVILRSRRGAGTNRAWKAPLIAGLIVLPWFAYCVYVAGYPLPQSGLATSTAGVYRPLPFASRLRAGALVFLVSSLWPLPPRRLVTHEAATDAVAALWIGVQLVAIRLASLRLQRRALIAVSAVFGTMVVVASGYAVGSGAWFFLARYYVVFDVLFAGLVACALLAIVSIAARWNERVAWAVPAAAVLVALAFIASDFELPRQQTDQVTELRMVEASAYLARCGRVGSFETGRGGFFLRDRYVNLDGKTNVDALDALLDHRFMEYLRSDHIDVIYTRQAYLDALTDLGERWQDEFDVQPDGLSSAGFWLVRRGAGCVDATS